jgi:hypothetical protein
MYRSTWSKPGHGRVPQAREEDLSPCSPPETVLQAIRQRKTLMDRQKYGLRHDASRETAE